MESVEEEGGRRRKITGRRRGRRVERKWLN